MPDEVKTRIIDELLADLEQDRLVLPTLPEVALRVRDALEDENASLKDVAEVIRTDAALSARLIQVANSPLMRTSRAIDTVESAVTRMGGNMVRNLVTSMVMEQMFQATSEATDTRLRALWTHSLEVGAIAHALASQYTRLDPSQALLCGLVHDIGALPILARAEEVPELLADETLLDSVIRETHACLGRAILERWNFPPEQVTAVAEHENLARTHEGPADLADVVTVANLQSRLGTDHPLTREDWSAVPAFDKLGLAADVNVVEMEQTGDDIAAVKVALSA